MRKWSSESSLQAESLNSEDNFHIGYRNVTSSPILTKSDKLAYYSQTQSRHVKFEKVSTLIGGRTRFELKPNNDFARLDKICRVKSSLSDHTRQWAAGESPTDDIHTNLFVGKRPVIRLLPKVKSDLQYPWHLLCCEGDFNCGLCSGYKTCVGLQETFAWRHDKDLLTDGWITRVCKMTECEDQ